MFVEGVETKKLLDCTCAASSINPVVEAQPTAAAQAGGCGPATASCRAGGHQAVVCADVKRALDRKGSGYRPCHYLTLLCCDVRG